MNDVGNDAPDLSAIWGGKEEVQKMLLAALEKKCAGPSLGGPRGRDGKAHAIKVLERGRVTWKDVQQLSFSARFAVDNVLEFDLEQVKRDHPEIFAWAERQYKAGGGMARKKGGPSKTDQLSSIILLAALQQLPE